MEVLVPVRSQIPHEQRDSGSRHDEQLFSSVLMSNELGQLSSLMELTSVAGKHALKMDVDEVGQMVESVDDELGHSVELVDRE